MKVLGDFYLANINSMKLLSLIIVIAALGLGWFFWQRSQTSMENMSTGTPAEMVSETPKAPEMVGTPEMSEASKKLATYTAADVAMHASESSCYTIIRGNVYDVSAFVDKHPGGDKNILKTCGIDATSLFEKQHGGQPDPEEALKGFQIGTLTQ